MAKKQKTPEPISEAEAPLEGGVFAWVAPNPPTHAGYICQCSNANCGYYIWGNGLAVRNKRGAWLSLNCAVREKTTTLEEAEAAFEELLRIRGVPTKEEQEAAEKEAAKRNAPRKRRKRPEKEGRDQPHLPRGMTPSSTLSGDLASDALVNAPDHVRKRMAKRRASRS